MDLSRLILVVILAGASNAESVLRNNTKTGQLEIFHKKKWRGIVRPLWTIPKPDYHVFCKTLGMPSDDAWIDMQKNPPIPNHPVSLTLWCWGNETSITECLVFIVEEETAPNMKPIYMHCDDLQLRLAFGNRHSGAVQKLSGHRHPLVCPGKFVDDRRFAQVVCRAIGLNSGHAINIFPTVPEVNRTDGIPMILNCSDEAPASECSIHSDDFNLWCNANLELYGAVFCTDTAPQYRLTNIDNSTGIGRLEIKVVDVWGAVCANIGDDAFATVACKTLGLPSTNAQSFPYMYMGNAYSEIYQAKCTGNESSLEECRSRWGKRCEFNAFLGLSCSNATQAELRLNSLKHGRLQIYNKEQWLGISVNDSTSFGIDEATVICRSLNMSTIAGNGTLSNKTEDCWLAVERCSGNESSIIDCGNATISKSPFQCQPFRVICGDGEEDVRIADDGKFEVRHLGVWGSVTAEPEKNFLNFSASFVCKALNQSSTLASVSHRQDTPARTGPIWYTGLKCRSDAKSIDDCSFTFDGSYDHDDDVYISCQELNVSSVEYALSKMEVPEVGIPKMSINGEWGLVCLKGNVPFKFVKNVVQVLCRSLGMRSDGARFVVPYLTYTAKVNTHKLWFDAAFINCTGKEDSILNCTHQYPGDVYLGSTRPYELVPIYCGAPQEIPDFTVRLKDGPDSRSGRLELMMYNYWGTICDEGFTSDDASSVCYNIEKTLKLRSFIAKRGEFKSGAGKLWPYKFSCYAPDISMDQCLRLPKTKNNCTHSRDVGVVCKVITPTPTEPKGLSTGAIIGISIGVCAGLVIIQVVVGVGVRKRKLSRQHVQLK